MLRLLYGEMIIQKESILYHTSDDLFIYQNFNDKPFLFCTFHPSEYTGDNKYVHFIKIKKELSLLFMIDSIKNLKIYSSLNQIINHPNKNLVKKHNYVLKNVVNDIKKENFDGWFSSIENKGFVEVALINEKNLFEVIDSQELNRNWKNGNNLNNQIFVKNWGKKYEICTIKNPVILNINQKYQDMIIKYKEYEKKSNFPLEYIFQVILENAIINYF
jgi:hypothetical protein